MFGFGSMSPFFHDEYLFNDDERPRRQRKQRNEGMDTTCYRECLDCGEDIEIATGDTYVICPHCGSRFGITR
jgi:predicted RNA-binding Zn-ribbon protein involved in translation (DUF1610 family)